MCQLAGSLQSACVFFSSFSILLVAVDRYLFILCPSSKQISTTMVSRSHSPLFIILDILGRSVLILVLHTLHLLLLPPVHADQAGGEEELPDRESDQLLLWGDALGDQLIWFNFKGLAWGDSPPCLHPNMLHHPAPHTLPHRGDHLRQGLEGLLCQGVPDQHDQHSQVDQEDGKEEED